MSKCDKPSVFLTWSEKYRSNPATYRAVVASDTFMAGNGIPIPGCWVSIEKKSQDAFGKTIWIPCENGAVESLIEHLYMEQQKKSKKQNKKPTKGKK